MATSAGAISVIVSSDNAQFDSAMPRSAALAEQSFQRISRAQQSAQKDGDSFVASIKRQVDGFGLQGTALIRYQAQLKGVGDAAEPLIQRLQRLQDAQAAFSGGAPGLKDLSGHFEEAANSAGHASHGVAGMTRELLVLGHEASQGSYKRLGGSVMVMGELLVGMGLSLTGVLLPLAAVGLAIGSFVAAVAIGAHETTLLNNAMKVTGNYAGQTQASITALSRDLGTTLGVGIGKARTALEELVKTGEVGPDAVRPMATAVLQLEKLTGESSETIVKDFAKMGDGVAKWAEEHNKQYNYVSGDQYAYIKRLEEQGNKEAAEAENLRILNEHLQAVQPNLGYLERAWKAVGAAASGAWERMKGVGRAATVDDEIEKQQKRVDQLSKKPFGSFAEMAADNTYGQHLKPNADAAAIANSDLRLAMLAKEAQANSALAQAESDRAHKAQIAAIDSRDRWREETKGISLANKELEKYRTLTVAPLKGTANEISASEQAAEEAAIRKKYDPIDTKAAKQLDTRYKDRLEALTAEGIKLDQEVMNFQKYGKAINDSHLALVNLEIAQGKLQGLGPTQIGKLQDVAKADDAKAALLSQAEARAKATAAASKFIAKLNDETAAQAMNARESDLATKMAQLNATGIEKGGLAYDIYAEQVRQSVAAKYDDLLVRKLANDQMIANDEAHKLDVQTASLTAGTLERQNATIALTEYNKAQALIAANPGQADSIGAAQKSNTEAITAANTRLFNSTREFSTGATIAFQKYQEDAANSAQFAQTAISGSLGKITDSLAAWANGGKLNIRGLFLFMAEEFEKQLLRMQVAAATASATKSGGWLSSLVSLAAGYFGSSSDVGAGTVGGSNVSSAGVAQEHYATGTNYVPRDMLAQIHEGEAVVPKAYNPSAMGQVGGGSKRPLQVNVHTPPGVQHDQSQESNDGNSIDVFLSMAEQRIASGIAGGRGPVHTALKSRGVNVNGNLARRA